MISPFRRSPCPRTHGPFLKRIPSILFTYAESPDFSLSFSSWLLDTSILFCINGSHFVGSFCVCSVLGRRRHARRCVRWRNVSQDPQLARSTVRAPLSFYQLTTPADLRSTPRRKHPKISFYDKKKPYYEFTNFSPHDVLYKGKRYPTSEHLFQAFKVCVFLVSKFG
jgi:hypothetical protein